MILRYLGHRLTAPLTDCSSVGAGAFTADGSVAYAESTFEALQPTIGVIKLAEELSLCS